MDASAPRAAARYGICALGILHRHFPYASQVPQAQRETTVAARPSRLHEWVDDLDLPLDQLSVLQVFGKEDFTVGSKGGRYDD